MAGDRIRPYRQGKSLTTSVLGLVLFYIGGCAGDPPKPVPAVTPEQVRSHADEAFDNLKQEERDHEVNPTTTP